MTDIRAAAQQALEALENAEDQLAKPYSTGARCAITALRAALAEPVQEPVAWYFEARHIDSAWGPAISLKHPGAEGVYLRKVTPLYAAPPQRKPLTEEEIWKFWWSRPEVPDGEDDSMEAEFVAAVRRVLAAHGIGSKT
jgi:hypothetical protein